MASKGVILSETPLALPGVSEDTRYAAQNKSNVPVILTVATSQPLATERKSAAILSLEWIYFSKSSGEEVYVWSSNGDGYLFYEEE